MPPFLDILLQTIVIIQSVGRRARFEALLAHARVPLPVEVDLRTTVLLCSTIHLLKFLIMCKHAPNQANKASVLPFRRQRND